MTCKRIYTKLLSLEHAPPPTCEKKLLTLGYWKDDLSKLYLLPFGVTKEVKLSMFQYKIIHNVLCKKSLLFKMKKMTPRAVPFVKWITPLCTFHWMHTSYFVLERVSGLVLTRCEFKTTPLEKWNHVWHHQQGFDILIRSQSFSYQRKIFSLCKCP